MFLKVLLSFLIVVTASFLLLPSNDFSSSIKLLNPQGQKIVNTPVPTKPEFKATSPSLEQIFRDDHAWTATLSAERIRVMLATGDVLPARHVNIQTTNLNNFKWPYEKTADVLREADLTLINLETPLIKDCPLIDGGFTFCGNQQNVEGLVFAGVDVASLANNHAGNFGLEGVNYTTDLLNSNGILVTGRQHPVYKDIRGLKFAFLGYNDIGLQEGVASADEAKIQSDISEARKEAEVVVVAFHWGVEYQNQPSSRQRYLGHFAINAGADLVIGNHPHWIQPIEIYKDKIIAYAHGNFVFDQEWSLKTKQGVIGRYTFYDNQLVDVEFLPVLIVNYGQPYFLSGSEKDEIINDMKIQSEKLNR